MIEQIIIFGAISSGMYALLALGFSLIYGVTDVVNMAHGAFFMLGAYIFFAFTSPPPHGFAELQLVPAAIVTVILVGVLGSIFYKLTIHTVIDDIISVLVITVAATLIFEKSMILQFGSRRWPVPSFFPGFMTLLGIKITYSRILAFAASMLLFAIMWLFIRKSKMGTAMRAISQDREAAMLMGINTEKIYVMTMAVSSALAAIAGILLTSATSGVAYPYMWQNPLVISFAVVIIGGLGSIKGTLVGAFIIGYLDVTSFRLGLGSLGGAIPLLVMVLILLFRPKGLFGKRVELE